MTKFGFCYGEPMPLRLGPIVRDDRPKMAFDAKPARDEGGKGISAIDVLLRLKERMSPEGFRALLKGFLDVLDDGEAEKRGQDEPAPFKGRPRPGGAMDAMAFDRMASRPMTCAEKSFAKMFPDAAKIKSAPSFVVKG